MINDDIKREIKAKGLHQYKIADLLGISETTLVRWLRYELTPERRELIMNAIKKGEKNHE